MCFFLIEGDSERLGMHMEAIRRRYHVLYRLNGATATDS